MSLEGADTFRTFRIPQLHRKIRTTANHIPVIAGYFESVDVGFVAGEGGVEGGGGFVAFEGTELGVVVGCTFLLWGCGGRWGKGG